MMAAEKYILQYGSLAGWPYQVAAGLRAAGLRSINVVPQTQDVEDLDRRLPFDRAINQGHPPRAQSLWNRGRFLLEVARKASVIHYHGSVILGSLSHPWLEGQLFQRLGIPMVMSFGGTEARIIAEARERNPYFHLEADDRRDDQIRGYLASISKRIQYAATDYEMMTYVRPYFRKCFVFRQPVDVETIGFNEPRTDRPPVLLHVPTNTNVKGTDRIVEAVERLKAEGHIFEFRMKRRLSQRELYAEIADCDVYIDELRCGAHGVTAVEAMAAGKPTMTFIRDDLVSHYPAEMPLINTNPDNIYQKIRSVIENQDLRVRLSYESRKYCEKYHATGVVVRDLVEMYRQIGTAA